MLEKISNLKSDNRIIQFLYSLLKIILLLGIGIFIVTFFISPVIRNYLVNSAKKLLESSKAKDDKLKEEISQLEKQAQSSEAKIDALDKKLKEIKKDENVNWHLKKK